MKSLSRKETLFVTAATICAILALTAPALTAAANWLIVEDQLQPSDAVVVLGGHVPFRAMEAAALYNEGWAAQVWLTQGEPQEEDVELSRLNVERPPEHELSLRVLVRLGVPAERIRTLRRKARNTADEVQAIEEQMKTGGNDQVIVVTSKYHTRRVKVIWNELIGGRLNVIVRFARRDPFTPSRWWRTTSGANVVSKEWFGILNAWAGFPLQSR